MHIYMLLRKWSSCTNIYEYAHIHSYMYMYTHIYIHAHIYAIEDMIILCNYMRL